MQVLRHWEPLDLPIINGLIDSTELNICSFFIRVINKRKQIVRKNFKFHHGVKDKFNSWLGKLWPTETKETSNAIESCLVRVSNLSYCSIWNLNSCKGDCLKGDLTNNVPSAIPDLYVITPINISPTPSMIVLICRLADSRLTYFRVNPEDSTPSVKYHIVNLLGWISDSHRANICAVALRFKREDVSFICSLPSNLSDSFSCVLSFMQICLYDLRERKREKDSEKQGNKVFHF